MSRCEVSRCPGVRSVGVPVGGQEVSRWEVSRCPGGRSVGVPVEVRRCPGARSVETRT